MNQPSSREPVQQDRADREGLHHEQLAIWPLPDLVVLVTVNIHTHLTILETIQAMLLIWCLLLACLACSCLPCCIHSRT